MKKWGIALSGVLLVLGLLIPGRVWAGAGDNGGQCPCGQRGGGCASCAGGQTDQNGNIYCDKPGSATDPLCKGGGGDGCVYCPPGTNKVPNLGAPVTNRQLMIGCGCNALTASANDPVTGFPIYYYWGYVWNYDWGYPILETYQYTSCYYADSVPIVPPCTAAAPTARKFFTRVSPLLPEKLLTCAACIFWRAFYPSTE